MANFKDKISSLIGSQVPDFVLEEHPKFLKFLQTYYAFMESAELSVISIQSTDGILLETETNQTNLLLLDGTSIQADRTVIDDGDKLIYESSQFGKFTAGEIIVGQTSKATSTVITEDLDNTRLFIVSQDKFLKGETIIGLSSNANAIVSNYKPNPVNTIQELLNFRDPDKVISNFLSQFRNEFLNTFPENLKDGTNKRSLIKNVKSLYKSKGTISGHKLFFKLLFGENSETIYPSEQLLRVSDGKWSTGKIMRVVNTLGDTSRLISRSIEGVTSKATAIVENEVRYTLDSISVVEFTLNEDSIVGTFVIGETVKGTEKDDDDIFITGEITGIPIAKNIIADGAFETVNEQATITGGGLGAVVQIKSLNSGSVQGDIIDQGGVNYNVGDSLVFNNANTNGGGAAGFVSVVNGGVLNEDDSGDHILLETDTLLGDTYAGSQMMQESGTGVKDITKIYLYNRGSGYTSLPSCIVSSTTGTGALIKLFGGDIGRIKDLSIIESGINHQLAPTPPVLTFTKKVILTQILGTGFVPDETVNITGGITGIVRSWNPNLGLLRLRNVSSNIVVGDGTKTVTGVLSSTQGTIKVSTNASATLTIGAVGDNEGRFVNEDGFISENTIKVQDSLYYQDFSYVIKVGRSIVDWRDDFKKTMHTAGFYLAGQVNIESVINAQISTPLTGAISGVVDSPLFGIINTLFSTIFGRRLGTPTDGTTLRANAQLGVSADFNQSTVSNFSNTTRDVTLSRLPINIAYTSRPRGIFNNVNIAQGFVYAGPRYGTINREVIKSFTRQSGTNYSFEELSKNVTFGTRSSLDGTDNTLAFTATDLGRFMKTKLTIPCEVFLITPDNSFDNTLTFFDSDTQTFDDTTP